MARRRFLDRFIDGVLNAAKTALGTVDALIDALPGETEPEPPRQPSRPARRPAQPARRPVPRAQRRAQERARPDRHSEYDPTVFDDDKLRRDAYRRLLALFPDDGEYRRTGEKRNGRYHYVYESPTMGISHDPSDPQSVQFRLLTERDAWVFRKILSSTREEIRELAKRDSRFWYH